LISATGGKAFVDEKSAAEFVSDLLKNGKQLKEMSENAERFVGEKPNSTTLIIDKILSL